MTTAARRNRCPNRERTRPPRRDVPSIVLVNTGDGKGKSTAAFGTIMRAVARDWSVGVIQFMKSGKWRVGEEAVARQLGVDWWTHRRRLHLGVRRPRPLGGRSPARHGRRPRRRCRRASTTCSCSTRSPTRSTTGGSRPSRCGRPSGAGRADQRVLHRSQRPTRAGRPRRHGHRDAQGQARLRDRRPGPPRDRLLAMDTSCSDHGDRQVAAPAPSTSRSTSGLRRPTG